MFNYTNLKIKMKYCSTEKVNNVIETSWYGNTCRVILIYILINQIIVTLFQKANFQLYSLLYSIILIITIIYLITRKSALALTEHNLVYVVFKRFTYNAKEIHEIPRDKIKNISYHKIAYIHILKLSFIAANGRLTTKKIYFSTSMIGKDKKEYQESGKKICDELKKLQKVIEKGDF